MADRVSWTLVAAVDSVALPSLFPRWIAAVAASDYAIIGLEVTGLVIARISAFEFGNLVLA